MRTAYDYESFSGIAGDEFDLLEFRSQTIYLAVRTKPDGILRFSYDGETFGEDIHHITGKRTIFPYCCRAVKVKKLSPAPVTEFSITGYF